ncbi:CYFA0S04e04962g1_1 [Cyberlindnera fabianii]|uniref:CYFA0S04e04962g1_1 n=1 Tax=Cyberlindnera fabianii TaxID=36022 RepID=A0A061ARI0_CYBFA|nr:CYFA0S04e04962g1_1 [Cyberlindnera fabianii]
MPDSNTINKAPPFLELSRTTLESIDTSGLDIESVLSVWTGLTKCTGFVKNGKRLENISWRIVNRQLVNSRQQSQDEHSHEKCDLQPHKLMPTSLPSNSLGKSTAKLNDSDLFSLLSIVAEETLTPPPQRPQLTKRKSSSKSNLFLSKKSSESLIQRPPMFRKSSSSKSLKKLNQKKKSTVDLTSLTPSVPQIDDREVYEQPHPRYAFGIYDKDENAIDENNESANSVRPPSLKRSDTSTSVIRGFSTDKPSVVTMQPVEPLSTIPKRERESPKKTTSHSTPSLFGNSRASSSSSSVSTSSSVEQKKPSQQQTVYQPKPTAPHAQQRPLSLFTQPQQPPNNRSRSMDRVKSPLSHETTSEVLKGKSATSLFANNNNNNDNNNNNKSRSKPKPTSLFTNSNKSGPPHSQSTGAMKSMLFDQVGISPNVKKTASPPLGEPNDTAKRAAQPVVAADTSLEQSGVDSKQEYQQPPKEQQHHHQKKRTTVLNNLGMTSLTKNDPKKEKNMFFIESSPSPTEQPKFIETHASKIASFPEIQNHQAPTQPHGHHQQQHHHHHNNSHPHQQHTGRQKSNSSTKSSRSPPPPQSRSKPAASNTSLFQGKIPVREIMFSSDDSLSEESDWSSVSEDMDTDDEEAARQLDEQLRQPAFKKRDENVTKPQIKRSLLSGLFLNEMQPEPVKATPAAPNVTATTTVSKAGTSDGHELSSSLSSAQIQIKPRSQATKANDKGPLELNTTGPHAEISTSNINVPGTVNEPHEISSLKEKLESTQEASHTPLSSSFTQIAKSALNLTNYFASHRKNSFSSIASDRTRVRFKHESRAPPTASTLLPTALSTHMFLPNAHQRAKSRLASVVESDASSGVPSTDISRKNSDTDAPILHSDEKVVKPIKSPTVPIKTHRIRVDIQDDEPVVEHMHQDRGLGGLHHHTNNISRKLSPKTTRKQMLATELSDSLRKSILWDRQYGMYPAGDSGKVTASDGDGVNGTGNGHINGGDFDGNNAGEKLAKGKAPKIIKPELEKNNDDDWESESFYARGW